MPMGGPRCRMQRHLFHSSDRRGTLLHLQQCSAQTNAIICRVNIFLSIVCAFQPIHHYNAHIIYSTQSNETSSDLFHGPVKRFDRAAEHIHRRLFLSDQEQRGLLGGHHQSVGVRRRVKRPCAPHHCAQSHRGVCQSECAHRKGIE